MCCFVGMHMHKVFLIVIKYMHDIVLYNFALAIGYSNTCTEVMYVYVYAV